MRSCANCSGVEDNRPIFVRGQFDRLLKLHAGRRSLHHALHRADRWRCAAPHKPSAPPWPASTSVKCVTASGERSVTAPVVTRSTAPHRPMSLSGGHGFQSTQLMPRSFSVGANVSTASTFFLPGLRRFRHIEVISAIRARNLRRVRDLVAVQPDFAAVVDAAEVQPRALARMRGSRRRELFAIPPAAVIGAVLRHGQVGEVVADGIGRARNLAQVHRRNTDREQPPPRPAQPAPCWARPSSASLRLESIRGEIASPSGLSLHADCNRQPSCSGVTVPA